MPSLLQRYSTQRSEVENYRQLFHSKQPVCLLAVSKTKPTEDIVTLYKAGQRDFGENYLQEALKKQQELAHFDISWHFIGPIQSNKTRDLAKNFNWVHSVDRLKVAKRLNEQRPSHLPPLNICLQVNIDEEETKSGLLIDELAPVVKSIIEFDRLRLRGLMAIPRAAKVFDEQCKPFKKLATAKDQLNQQFNIQMDTLSMGMSTDLKAAISEGSTIVRIGTAIFGARKKPK
jgi:pyridoxal phosphate enzyme (YggS family)